MGCIYYNKHEIPIPEGALINSSDGRVFIMHRDETGRQIRLYIGKATSKTTMHPNKNFRFKFAELWRQYYGDEDSPRHELHVGLYSLFLASAWKTELYPIMQKVFGPLHTNVMLDYAMYCVHARDITTELMENSMYEHMLFSEKQYSDSWYSDFFEKKLSLDDVHQFKIEWLKQYSKTSEKAWICIDGSNNDCVVKDSTLAEYGNDKSHKGLPVYGYMWAVSATDGMPITYFVNNGSKIDCKSFEKMAKFLADAKIEIAGVILDRGFATEDVLKLIKDCGYEYIVMLKSSCLGFQTMFEKHAEEIRQKVKNSVNDQGLFGTTERTQVFGSGTEQACIGLYYNNISSSYSSNNLIKQVLDAARSLKADIARGKHLSKLSVPKKVKRYLYVDGSEEHPEVKFHYDEWQKEIDSKGYSAIASSKDRTAQEITELYDLRDVSEKQFSCLKSQLGCDVTRVHTDQRIEAKMAICFIACIIRTVIQKACSSLILDTNKVITDSDRTIFFLLQSGKYEAVHDCSNNMRAVYKSLGLTNAHFDFFADELNQRGNPIHSQTRIMPDFNKSTEQAKDNKKKPEQDEKAKDATPKPKGKAGRPKGSKNKATIEREQKLQEDIASGKYVPPAKRSPGRPKGSKNKKTLEREAKLKAQKEQEQRGRGRPKGSKNKKTLAREAQMKKDARKLKKKDQNSTPAEQHVRDPKRSSLSDPLRSSYGSPTQHTEAQSDPKTGGSNDVS